MIEKILNNRYKYQVDIFNKAVIGKPQEWLIEEAASIGLDYSGLFHETTNEFVKHCIKQHGNDKTERSRGQLPVTITNIDEIPDIIKNPDCTIIGIKKYGQIYNVYLKNVKHGAVIYYEEVLNSKKNKSLRSKTMYIKMETVSEETFLNIVSNNANTDMSGSKIVVGAGGNPGGEAA